MLMQLAIRAHVIPEIMAWTIPMLRARMTGRRHVMLKTMTAPMAEKNNSPQKNRVLGRLTAASTFPLQEEGEKIDWLLQMPIRHRKFYDGQAARADMSRSEKKRKKKKTGVCTFGLDLSCSGFCTRQVRPHHPRCGSLAVLVLPCSPPLHRWRRRLLRTGWSTGSRGETGTFRDAAAAWISEKLGQTFPFLLANRPLPIMLRGHCLGGGFGGIQLTNTKCVRGDGNLSAALIRQRV
ncbi:hypothetical protein IWX49DRAFT_159044 [Phyllosticta citricarpa]|uniref:Uncharacterized protein n=2 Tax=Phyllosticta TaxID=121621 RepID=A0ABR1M6K1_9PEZI